MYVIRRRLILSYPIQLVIPKFVPNFKILAVAISEKFVTEVKLERKKKNGRIKRMISRRRLILSYMMQLVILKISNYISKKICKNFNKVILPQLFQS